MAPVGFRFHPTEEELICYYLKHKMNGHDSLVDDLIGEADLYRRDPWELPDSAKIKSEDRVWYYFCRLDYKYSNRKRTNRETKNGFWKLTGKVRDIKARRTGEVVGTKKTLVFHYRDPDSKKVVGTSWVIHEFHAKTSTPDQRVLVICMLKYKADDSAGNLPNDEGERIRVMVSNLENNAVQNNNQELDARQLQSLSDSHGMDFDFFSALQSQNHVQNNNQEVDARQLQSLIDSHGMDFDFFPELQSHNHVQNNNQEVNAEQLQSLVDSQEAGFNFPFALQSQNRVQNCLSDEEDMTGFADSLLIVPDECGVENPAHPLLNDYIPSKSSSKDYVLDSSDRETYLAYGESQNRVQNCLSDEEDTIGFADSLLIDPDECGVENYALALVNGYIPSSSSSEVYVLDDSDRETYLAYGESQNRVQNCLSDEEDTIRFADSLLIVPDECGVENHALALLNDYIPSKSSSKVHVLDDSDRETYLAYGETSDLYGGHGSAKEHRQMQMSQSDDILLMGSSMDSTTATRHEQISLIQPIGVDFPRIHKPQNPPRARSFLEHEGISPKGDQLECGSLSTASKHEVRDRAKQVADIDLPKKAGKESEKDREIVQVTNAKPDVKSRSDDSVGNERRGRFIHLEKTTSSHLSSPSSVVYLLNSVLGLVLFIIMLREVLIVH